MKKKTQTVHLQEELFDQQTVCSAETQERLISECYHNAQLGEGEETVTDVDETESDFPSAADVSDTYEQCEDQNAVTLVDQLSA